MRQLGVYRIESPQDITRRVCIQADIARTLDLALMATDPAVNPLHSLDACERVRSLAVLLGDVAACEDVGELHGALVALAAGVQGWLETIARDEAA